MGQNDSKEIQENVDLLEKQNLIQHSQRQKFIHDYHTNQPIVQDVKKFEDNKLKIFLKYFILEKYPSRTNQKANTKRTKTNQSALSQEQKDFDSLVGMLCFQTYKIEESFFSVCKLINKSVLSSDPQFYLDSVKQILSLIGIKELNFIVCNKNNIQQQIFSFKQVKDFLRLKTNLNQQSPFPRSQKHKLRKLKKSEMVQQRIVASQNQAHSDFYYVQQTPSKQKTSILAVSLKSNDLMETKMEKKQIQNLIERYLSQVGQFISRIILLIQKNQNSIQSLVKNKQKQNLPLLQKQSHSQINNSNIADLCWNFLKIYKASFDFEHSLLLQKIKSQNKKSLQLTLVDTSLQQIKIKIQQKFQKENANNKLQYQDSQTLEYFNNYENKYMSIKNDLSQYLQKYFNAVSSHTIQLQFDSNTELKIIISSLKNTSIFQKINEINLENKSPTLIDLFKQQKIFQQFYKNSYNSAIKKLQSAQKIFVQNQVSLQFSFNGEGLLKRIKISMPQNYIFQQGSDRFSKESSKKTQKIQKSMQKQKKKFTSFHNQPKQLEQMRQQNKQNNFNKIKIKSRVQTQQEEDEQSQSKGSLKNSLKISKANVKSHKKVASILDLTSVQMGSQYNLYDKQLNILEIQQSKHLQLAHNLLFELDFLKKQQIKSQYEEKFICFLTLLQDGYQEHRNPFHNFVHGVNVMHTSFILCKIKNISNLLSDFSKFALVLSALCHDVGHTGFNNAFEIASNSRLAQAFNDCSPLQNYHISRTLQLFKNEKSNFLDFLSTTEKSNLRKYLISNILNTDMKEHFNVLKKFQDKKLSFKKDDFEDEKIICGMLIHSSDFGGSIKEFQICQEWSRRVNQQFKNQSKKQMQLDLPLSPFMLNLDKQIILAKNELGFLKFMVQPLYKSLSLAFSSDELVTSMFNRVNENIEGWQKKIKILDSEEQILQQNSKQKSHLSQ